MWFGTGIHWALEHYYNPGFSRDPVEAWMTWFDIQWRGGTVELEWLDKVYDLKPRPKPDDVSLWIVRGLEDIIPDPDHEEFEALKVLGIEMMKFYKQYAVVNDDFIVFMTEHDFSVPIWDYENNCILKRIDVREESPNYGKELEVHARGRLDGLTVKPSGKMGIIDHKTAEKVGEEYFAKLETDEQCTSYLWAAEVEAQYYNLPHKGEPLEEVIYNTLRKAYPSPPTELKNGMFSVARDTESTTYDMLQEWIKTHIPGVRLSEKQEAYVDYLREVGDEQFIIRKAVRRNRHQLNNAGYRIYLEALDMLGDPRIYPNISNTYQCLNCVFRIPCIAREDGGDYSQLLRDNYVTAKDR
jgi:hypothetical protein